MLLHQGVVYAGQLSRQSTAKKPYLIYIPSGCRKRHQQLSVTAAAPWPMKDEGREDQQPVERCNLPLKPARISWTITAAWDAAEKKALARAGKHRCWAQHD